MSDLKNRIRSFLVIVWVVLSTIVYSIPCLILRIFSEKPSQFIAKLWLAHIAFFSGVKIKLNGIEKLDKNRNYVFVANHTSYFDLVALNVAIPFPLSFIAKKQLFAIPLFGWGLAAAGHISIDRTNPANAKKSMDKAVRIIKKKRRSIFGFPEGTRSATGQIGEFKLGLFNLALKAELEIVPVAIKGAKEVLGKDSLFIRPGTIELTILDPIPLAGYTSSDKFVIAEKIKGIITGYLSA